MRSLIRLSDALEAVLRWIAHAGAWSFLLCILVITFDVITRKVGFQLPELGSTRLQELEWHLHTVLFCCWLGYAYVRNAHVRIDVFTAGRSERSKIILELACCVVLALPYLWVALPYAWDFFMVSLRQGESSDAPTGLPARWVVKGFLLLGFVSVALAVVAVILRCTVALFGSREEAASVDLPFAR